MQCRPRAPAHSTTSGALVTTTTGIGSAARTTWSAMSRTSASRRARARRAPSRALPCEKDRNGTTTAASRGPGSRGMGCVCYRPMDALYPVAKSVFYPPLRYGLQWTIEGEEHLPADGPAVVASNHISSLAPLTLAYVANRQHRRVRFLA